MSEIKDKRLFDLVRYMRSELHEEDLITDEEYAILLNDSKSERRLNNYDQMRDSFKRQVNKLKKEIEELNAEVIRLNQLQSVKQHRMCGKKVSYQEHGEATREAFKRNMRAYRCPHCAEWHLTSKGVNK